jgi:hypothetical protein
MDLLRFYPRRFICSGEEVIVSGFWGMLYVVCLYIVSRKSGYTGEIHKNRQ